MKKRTEEIKIRLTPVEMTEIQKRVPEGVQRAIWARQVLLGEPVVFEKTRRLPPQADPMLIGQLGRIGSNINQVARWANTYKSEASAAGVVDELTAIRLELMQIAGGYTLPDPDAEEDCGMMYGETQQ